MRHPHRWNILHWAWGAFFLTFVVWFNLAPFKSTIGRALRLDDVQLNTLLICNVALTIPARVGIGMLVDRLGPRRVYTWLLAMAALPCLLCAAATSYWQLVVGRLLISCVGAGFVVGIRLIGEWFDATEIGWAEGLYGGLGNFGMAAATFGLPLVAIALQKLAGTASGWRWAMAGSGIACAMYAWFFSRNVIDCPPERAFSKAPKGGALEVCTRGDLAALVLMQVPMVFCLGLLVWKLVGVHMLSRPVSHGLYGLLVILLVQQSLKIIRTNRSIWMYENAPSGVAWASTLARALPAKHGHEYMPMAPRGEALPTDEGTYAFSQVAILCLCYAVTFGGELAVESMLPAYMEKMFHLSVALAGVMGAGFAFASLVARPLGGWLGDRLGRKPIMVAALGGSAAGFVGISMISAAWSLPAAMAVVVFAGVFLMAGNGANFCIAPLIRKPLTGQIAGLIGAYGNVGSVVFLTILSVAGVHTFFLTMIMTAMAAFACCFLLREPGAVPRRRVVPSNDSLTASPVALEPA